MFGHAAGKDEKRGRGTPEAGTARCPRAPGDGGTFGGCGARGRGTVWARAWPAADRILSEGCGEMWR